MKIKFNSVIVFVIVLLAACSSGNSPKAVAEKFLKSMSSQDFESAKKYGTEETEKLLDMLSGFSKMSPDTARNTVNFTITRESIDGDNAVIYYTEEGREGELQLPMIKAGGKWKVLLSKESINSADGSKSMESGATSTDTPK